MTKKKPTARYSGAVSPYRTEQERQEALAIERQGRTDPKALSEYRREIWDKVRGPEPPADLPIVELTADEWNARTVRDDPDGPTARDKITRARFERMAAEVDQKSKLRHVSTAEIDAWLANEMRRHRTDTGREISWRKAIAAMQDTLKCPRDEARAAWHRLPDEMKRRPGRPRQAEK